MKYLACT